MDFKQRVHAAIIDGAAIYQSVFVGYEYLIYGSGLTAAPYYIISATEDNYPHLTGVNPLLPAREFYNSCLNGTLRETDFNFQSKNRSEKEVIGSVRRKIQMLPLLAGLFSSNLQAEEDFVKGRMHCSLATTDNKLTIGFVDDVVLRPKTLLKNNELDPQRSIVVELVLRRGRGLEEFATVVQGNVKGFCALFPDMLGANLKL